MRKAILRIAAVTAAVGAVVATAALLPTSANAAPGDSKASAFGLSASVLNGLVVVPPTPARSCPPGTGGTSTAVGASLGTLGAVGVLTATNACNGLGVSSATGKAANVALTSVIPGLAAVTADLVTATCTANGTTNTGSTSLVNAKLGTTALNASPAPNTVLLNALGVTITLNEQTTTAGALTVNAIHIHANVLGLVTDVIIGSATCGPNVPVAPVAAFSYQNLPIVLGGLGIVVLIGFGLRTGTRRLRGLA